MYIIIIYLLYLYRLLIDKAQGMPGYVRHMLTDLLTTHQLQIVSLLQYQTEFDDFTWPEFERITGHPTVIERKRSMLHSKNKWAFHTTVSGLSVYNTVKWFSIFAIIDGLKSKFIHVLVTKLGLWVSYRSFLLKNCHSYW